MRGKVLSVCIMAAFMAASAASWAQSDPHNDGLNFGKGELGKTAGRVNDAKAKDVPYYNTNPPQTSSYGAGSLFEVGAKRITDCSNYVPSGDKLKDQECSAVNFLAKNPQNRVRITVAPNDPALIAGREAMNHATEGLADPGSCVQKTTTTPAEHAIESCSEYLTGSDQQCVIGRVVEANGSSDFQCDTSYKALETLTCSKRLQVTCAPQADGCDNGGIVPGSTQGDMKVVFGPAGNGDYHLDFGTFADNYWSGWGATFDRSLTFGISDKDKITQFKLIRAAFDDYISVTVNGHLAYVGPYGGDRLEVVNRGTYTNEMAPRQCDYYYDESGSGYYCYDVNSGGGDIGAYFSNYRYYTSCSPIAGGYSCYTPDPYNGLVQYGPSAYGSPELSTNWNQTLSIDLRPYLVNGSNLIQTRVIVAGNGEGAISLNARMMCPSSCTDTIVNECTTLEGRTQ